MSNSKNTVAIQANYYVFDFDGTIADIMKVAPEITNQVLKELNMPTMTRARMEEFRNYTISEGVRELGLPLHRFPRAFRLVRQHLKLAQDKIPPVEGMLEVLQTIRDNPETKGMFILTSNDQTNVTDFLERHAIKGIFDEVVTGLNLFNKPAKLKSLLHRHAISPMHAVMIGDELRDIDAATKNNVPAIAVAWGLGSRKRLSISGAETVVATTVELAQVLQLNVR